MAASTLKEAHDMIKPRTMERPELGDRPTFRVPKSEPQFRGWGPRLA
jgi:hypothetical protein